jgi:hypothetical protein
MRTAVYVMGLVSSKLELVETTISAAQVSSIRISTKSSLIRTQASVAVLLILGYGVAAEKYKLLSPEGEKVTFALCIRDTVFNSVRPSQNISHLGVTLLLPALLFTEIGPHATVSNLASCCVFLFLNVSICLRNHRLDHICPSNILPTPLIRRRSRLANHLQTTSMGRPLPRIQQRHLPSPSLIYQHGDARRPRRPHQRR